MLLDKMKAKNCTKPEPEVVKALQAADYDVDRALKNLSVSQCVPCAIPKSGRGFHHNFAVMRVF